MIYTITFNPALDYIVKMDEFNLGHVNRSNNEFVMLVEKELMYQSY